MKIKEVKEPKNKEELKKKISKTKKTLKWDRIWVSMGIPGCLALLGMTASTYFEASMSPFIFWTSTIILGETIYQHYKNQDNSYELHMMEEQLSKMKEEQPSEIEEIENMEEYTRSLNKKGGIKYE